MISKRLLEKYRRDALREYRKKRNNKNKISANSKRRNRK